MGRRYNAGACTDDPYLMEGREDADRERSDPSPVGQTPGTPPTVVGRSARRLPIAAPFLHLHRRGYACNARRGWGGWDSIRPRQGTHTVLRRGVALSHRERSLSRMVVGVMMDRHNICYRERRRERECPGTPPPPPPFRAVGAARADTHAANFYEITLNDTDEASIQLWDDPARHARASMSTRSTAS